MWQGTKRVAARAAIATGKWLAKRVAIIILRLIVLAVVLTALLYLAGWCVTSVMGDSGVGCYVTIGIQARDLPVLFRRGRGRHTGASDFPPLPSALMRQSAGC